MPVPIESTLATPPTPPSTSPPGTSFLLPHPSSAGSPSSLADPTPLVPACRSCVPCRNRESEKGSRRPMAEAAGTICSSLRLRMHPCTTKDGTISSTSTTRRAPSGSTLSGLTQYPATWVPLDPALRPSTKADKYGCWSGSATVLPDGMPMIMYTGISQKIKDWNYQVQNLAYPRNRSDPLLREWIKPAGNPVIVPDHNMNATLFRDPTTAWRTDGLWRLLVGSREGTTRGVAYLYRSHDFKQWARVRRPLHSAPTGMWECPDFYPVMMGGWQKGLDTSVTDTARIKHILKNSLDTRRYDYYTVGTYDRTTELYVPDNPAGDEHHLRYDYGNFYASKTFYDPSKQRRILWGWANESDTVDNDKAKGWAGIQAIPRKVWLDHGGKQLLQWPVEEVEALRGRLVTIHDRVIKPGDSVEVTGLQTAQADVEVTFEVPSMDGMEVLDLALAYDAQKLCSLWGADKKGGVGPFGLWVLASAKLEEKTAVFFRVFRAVGRNEQSPWCSCALIPQGHL